MKTGRKFALPEPQAVKEIHWVRRKIQRRAEKIGWPKYIEELNARQSLIAEPEPMVLKERPKGYGPR